MEYGDKLKFNPQKTLKQRTPSAKRNKINTIEKLTDYIRRQLGEPLIKVEVTNEQIEDCIFNSIDEFCEYGVQGLEEVAVFVKVDINDSMIVLDERVRAITNLRSRSNLSSLYQLPYNEVLSDSYLAMSFLTDFNNIDLTSVCVQLARMSNIQSMFDKTINYTFNENTKELRFLENLKGNIILLEMALQYEPKEEDMIYNNTWIKKNSTSRVKLLWGNNIGKYSSPIVNGATLNYDRIISEAQQELQEQHEELLETYREPLGIYVR